MKIVAEIKRNKWGKGMDEGSILLVKSRGNLYICSLTGYIRGKKIKCYSNDLMETINYYSKYFNNRRIFIYE